MTTEKMNGLIDKFRNPTLWITMIIFLSFVSVKLNNIDVISERQDKKITIQNELIQEINDLKMEIKDLELRLMKEIHHTELKITEEHGNQ